MTSSNLFGRTLGEKKIEPIMSQFPDILISKESIQEKIQKVLSVKGIAQKSAEAFVESIGNFNNFIRDCGLEHKFIQPLYKDLSQPVLKIDSPLTEKTIVMTGFRDKNLEEKIKLAGGKIGASVSKNTFVVIVKHLDEDTSKASDAKKIGVPLITIDDFNNKYF